MCSGNFPDDIIVCPRCKRDDEGYKSGLSESPFKVFGDDLVRCLCGCVFNPGESCAAAEPAERGPYNTSNQFIHESS